MGPHFFKCGKHRAAANSLACLLCFNGAALFQVRKDPKERKTNDHTRASMGPHFFKCGKQKGGTHKARARRGFNGAALFQVRKERIRARSRPSDSSFNGAALFQVRKEMIHQRIKSIRNLLQWGRTFSSAERV